MAHISKAIREKAQPIQAAFSLLLGSLERTSVITTASNPSSATLYPGGGGNTNALKRKTSMRAIAVLTAPKNWPQAVRFVIGMAWNYRTATPQSKLAIGVKPERRVAPAVIESAPIE